MNPVEKTEGKFYKIIDILESPDFIWGGEIYDLDGEKVLSSIAPSAVYELSRFPNKSGGVMVRLESNSPNLKLVYSITEENESRYPYMGITAQKGLMFSYYDKAKKMWFNLDCCCSREKTMECEINMLTCFTQMPTEGYELILYCPSARYITEMKLLYPEEFWLEPVRKQKGTILVVGGENTFGAGITGSSFLWSNILSRKLEYEVRNISCCETGSMLFTTGVIKQLRNKIGDYEIIIVETGEEEVDKYRTCLDDLFKQKKGIKPKILFISGKMCWNPEENDFYTHNSVLANDGGNVCMYRKIADLLEDNRCNL